MSAASLLAGWILVLGQWAGSIGAIAVAVLLIVKAYRKWNRIERAIGKNGDENLFEIVHRMSDQLAVIGSMQDVIDVPMMMLDSAGSVVSVNLSCQRFLGYTADELSHGGWRMKLDRPSLAVWDDAIHRRAIFDRRCRLVTSHGRTATVMVLAKPIWNKEKPLGWRCSIDFFRENGREDHHADD